MEIYTYGEDGLTLWALQTKLDEILEKLSDDSSPSECKLFFRPSFGRAGGQKSSQFGEFDFIVLAKDCLYLGESKWDRSSEIIGTNIVLRDAQLLRHKLFAFYVHRWAFGSYSKWDDFVKAESPWVDMKGNKKPLAPTGSLLQKNLQKVMEIIKSHFSQKPLILNVLLYLHSDHQISNEVYNNFRIVLLGYPIGNLGNYISIRFEINLFR